MPVPVLFRLAARHISRRFAQSLLFVLGVALGVAMVIAIDIANASSSRAFALSTESVAGRATHRVVGGPGGLPTDLYRQIRVDLGIRDSAPVVEEFVRAPDLGEQPLRILGVDTFAEAPFRDYLSNVTVDSQNTESGAFAAVQAFITQPDSVLISRTLAARFGVTVGDSVILAAGVERFAATIVGLLEPDDRASEQALDDLVLTDIATAQEIVGQPQRISRIDLIIPDTPAGEAQLDAIRAVLPEGTRLALADEDSNALRQMTAAFELNLQALSLLALVVGAFLIYNTVTFSVVQRRPVIGTMRALGATRDQIFWLVIGEAALLGVIGTVLGLGLGIIFGRAAVVLVSQTISNLYFTVNVLAITVTPLTLVKGAAIGVFASLAAAALPAFAATRTVPAGVMRRSTQEDSARRAVPLVTVAAVALNLAGLVLLQIPTESLVISFTALFCIIVGGALFTPLALVGAMRLSTPVTDRLFGVIGRMAPRSVARSLSRTAVAVAALTVAVSVIVGVSVMIASFRNTVSDWLEATLGGDVFVSAPLLTANSATVDVDPEVRDLLREVEGVASVSASRQVAVPAPAYPDLPDVNLIAVDYDIAEDRGFVWLAVDDHRAVLRGETDVENPVLVTEPFAFRRDITRENNTITLVTDAGPQTFTVVGVYYDYTTDQGTVYMYRTLYDRYFDDPFITSVAVFLEEGVDIAATVTTIRDEVLAGYDLQVQANRELRAGVFEIFDSTFAITIALRLLATVVAFIGILSALLALQLENTRQYGVMRATGMTSRQLTGFTLLQTGLMGIVAGLLALPVGLALALVLIYVINVRSFGWTMQFYPVPGEFATAFGVAVVAALLAGVYPALRLTRLLPAEAIRSE